MAFTSKTWDPYALALSDNELISGQTLSNVGVDQFVFLDALASANPLENGSASGPSTIGALFEDFGSISSLSDVSLFEFAPTKHAVNSGDSESQVGASDDAVAPNDTSSVQLAHMNFGVQNGSFGTLGAAPMNLAMTTSSNGLDLSNPFTPHTAADGVQTFVAPQSNIVPVTSAPVANSPDTLPLIDIVAASGDTSAGVLVNGDGEVVSVISNSTAGSNSNAGSSSSGSNSNTSTDKASASPFIINVTYDASVANAPAAFKTVVAAVVQYFESKFSDNVTININVGYGEVGGYTLDAGALGESLTYLNSYSYSQIKNALLTDAKTADDASSIASLPATSPVIGNFWTSTAEAKALGLMGASSQTDGFIGFSSGNLFDYNNSDGVTAGTYDFFGTVAHEISEVMGRSLFVGGTIGTTSNSYDVLDLFHYSANGVRNFSGTTPGYFSTDGGATHLNNFNTNPNGDFGDWASSAGADAFSAFGTPGAVDVISQADLRELDVIGWNLGSSTSTPTSPPSPPVPTPPPAKPDLAISKFAFIGSHFNYELDNIGSGIAGASTDGIYVSTSPNGASSLIGTISSPALAAGGADTETGSITWGSGTTGTYYVSVKADYNNAVAESNESNNQSGQVALFIGNSSNNALTGTSGNDVMFGMGGKDTLTGGAGADQFVFNTALKASTNVASITDFSSAQGDKIDLDHTVFTKLTPGGLGAALANGDFYASSSGTAHASTDHILYNTQTGALSYDMDGNGAAAAVQFAVVSNASLHPALTAHDFLLV